MLLLLDNPKKGDKLTLIREYAFGKGEYKETCKIVSVYNQQVLLDNGETYRYFKKS